MGKHIYISGSVDDGEYISEHMSADFPDLRIAYILFFNESGDRVTPTDGVIKVYVSADGDYYKRAFDYQLSADSVYSEVLKMPSYTGLAQYCKIKLSGIVGAVTFKAAVWRSDINKANPLTSSDYGNERVRVDAQQTSFEDNEQFRFFDRIVDVPYTSQVVYKITVGANPINLFKRRINLWEGGREYLVYADDGNVTFTGTLADSGVITPLNTNLSVGLPSHKNTQASAQRADGASIFSSTSEPVSGTAALTDGNANRASTQYSNDDERLGVAAGTVIWAVFEHIGANNDTNGHYELAWEERFAD